jgi:hypothetical protein
MACIHIVEEPRRRREEVIVVARPHTHAAQRGLAGAGFGNRSASECYIACHAEDTTERGDP